MITPLWRTVEFFASCILIAMMALTVLDVFGRYFLNAPFPGAYELTRVLMGLLVFSALPIVSGREGHITVDLLVGSFASTERRKAAQRGAVNLTSALVMGFIAWRVWEHAEHTMRSGDNTPSLSLPLYPFLFYMAILGGITSIMLGAVWYSYLSTGRNLLVRPGVPADMTE